MEEWEHSRVALSGTVQKDAPKFRKKIIDGFWAGCRLKGDIDADLFRATYRMGLEAHDRAYGAGTYTHWLEVKSRAHPSYSRVMDQF
jgi:hypothetical protein